MHSDTFCKGKSKGANKDRRNLKKGRRGSDVYLKVNEFLEGMLFGIATVFFFYAIGLLIP
jgi:hypothetical protein